jgi:hypothetical protein
MRGTRANVAPAPTGKSKRASPFDEPTLAAAKRPPIDLARNGGAHAEVRREQAAVRHVRPCAPSATGV